MNRTTLLIFALLAAAGFWVANHWDEVRVALSIEDPVELRAMKLAKADYSLALHLTNSAVIEAEMESTEGIEAIGWKAEAKSERLYLVKFLYTLYGDPGGYYFEVDVGALTVRHIEADSELAAKYGIASPSPR